jgi:hypothetical protein
MGGVSSSLNTKSPLSILTEAEEAKKTPEEVIRWILANADFTDMLDLVNLEKCRLYMWQGMKLVKRVDQAPRAELSIDQQRYENTRCFKRSRYYVFLMQNVMALALTAWNTPPLKRDTIYKIKPPSGGASRRSSRRRRSSSSSSRKNQIGGTITEPRLREDIGRTVFSSFLINFFDIDSSTARRGYERGRYDRDPYQRNPYEDIPTTWLKSSVSGTQGTLFIEWESPRRTSNTNRQLTLKCEYNVKSRTDAARNYPGEIQLKQEGSDGGITMFLGSSDSKRPIARIFSSARPSAESFSFILESSGSARYSGSEIKKLFEAIHNYFINGDYGTGYVGTTTTTGWNTGRRATSGSLSTIPRGVYAGLDILEPLFRSVFNNQATMPKAYLVARAMTLMDPIFPYEQQGRPILSHVCNTDKMVDDTTRREYAMPGPGSSPKTNIYLRSFVALFYTAELESTDTSTRSAERIRMRKTPEMEAELKGASELMAKLYNIRENRETFLESDKPFTAYGGRLCGDNKTKSYPFEYRHAELIQRMQEVVIAPMLEYQRQHNKAVTDILKRMFIKTGDSLKLSAELEADLNTETDRNLQVYCAAIRNLLLNYYLKAEAFFIMGVLLLEKYRRYTSLEA